MRRVSVVVPVYQSQGTLADLVRRLKQVLPNVSESFEVILVDDGSVDNSWEIVSKECAVDTRIRGIRLSQNFGQHNALLCGIRSAKYEILVTLDDDLQNPPEEIPILLQKLDEGYDVVYGTRVKEQHGFTRNFASRVTKWVLQSSMGAATARQITGFRAFRTVIRDSFSTYSGSYVCLDVLLTWATTRFASITVRHEARLIGKSTYSLGKLLQHTFNMVTGFSTLPLRIASLIGFFMASFGFLVLVYVAIRWLMQGSVVPGFVFLASIITIFSGAQLFALGIMGEYLARIHFRTMQKPPYVVRTECGKL